MMTHFTINFAEKYDSTISIALNRKNAKMTQKIKQESNAQSFLS